MVELQTDVETGRRCFEHPQSFRHDFGADAISGDDGDAMGR